MSKNTWDAVLASAPLNATAGRVTSRKVDGYQPVAKITQDEWGAPPRLRPVPAGVEDLCGRAFGRLKVIGVIDERTGGKGPRWCCRCACGKYVARRSKAILNPANAEVDRCTHCKHTAFLQREASFERTKFRRLNGVIGAPDYKDGRGE